ncbi:N-acetylmuramoyl-L-alanine amidase [bacterium]|nr:N-acetylmuramoyl-L-alanine amidase [bacterium]
MPATKLIKIRKAVMRQMTKIRGLKYILTGAMALATITMPATLWSQPVAAENEWVVVIDAGHGGRDPGALGSKAKEKNINLAVALKTGKYISENLKDVKVIYTRKDDTYPGLDERAEIANKNKADLFISIHSNAISDKRFSGAETYVLGQTMDEANLQVAMKENSVITYEKDYQTKYEGFDPTSAESYIIFSLMQNTYLKQSTEFATMIQNQFRDRVGRKDRGVKQAGFVVLWRATMPSVLVELGFVSNPEEEKYLLSEQGQDYLASAIFRAFRDYKQTIDSRSGMKPGNYVEVTEEPEVKPDTAGKPAAGSAGSTGSTGSTGKQVTEVSGPGATPADTGTTPSTQPAKTAAEVPDNAQLKEKETLPSSTADDIFFMVQISAMPRDKEMPQSQLKGIETITKLDDGERIKYAAGKFSVYDDAIKYRRTLVLRFPDAFVIASRNGKIMPLGEAIEAKKQK